jgi:hypothetical protein
MAKGLVGGPVGAVKETLFGGNTDEEDRKAEEAAAAALAEWEKVNLPDLQPIEFQTYDWQGDYSAPASVVAPTISAGEDVQFENVDPRLADTALVDGTSFDDIEADPRLRDAQMGSLSALDDIISGGGMTARERADLERVKSDVAASDRGRRDAILQNAAARGMSGSGMELLAQLQSSQAATDRAAQSGLEIEAQAQDRALAALMNKGAMAGDIRGQDFGEASKAAAARDAIAQFNAGSTNQTNLANMSAANSMALANAENQLKTGMYNRDTNLGVATQNANMAMDASKTNAGYANDAALYNHQGKQTTSNANKDVKNKQTVYNQSTLPQQQFENAATIAGGKSGAHQANQAYWTGKGDREAAEADQMFGSAIQLGAAGIASDERAKTDKKQVADSDITAFLDSVQPKRFRYKEPNKPGRSPGERVGVMAQDLEQTPLGDEIVREMPDGTKALDRDNLLGVIVASLGHLAKKGK